MVKNGAKSASNVQAGAFGELDSQDHGLPQQRYDRPSLVSEKRTVLENLLLLAAEVVSGAVGTAEGTRNSLFRGHAAAAGLFWKCGSDCPYFWS